MRRNLNKASAPVERFVSSIAGLAAATGLSDRQWTTYTKRDGFPSKTAEGYDVAACQAWHKENVNQTQGKPQGDPESLSALRAEKIKVETALLNIKKAKEERSVIDADALDQFHMQLALRQRSALQLKLVTELNPKLEGLDAAARLPMLERTVDEICQIMRDSFDEWAEQ